MKLENTRVAKTFSDLPLFGSAYAQNAKGEWLPVEITDHTADGRSAIFNEVSFRFVYAQGISQGYTSFVHRLRVDIDFKASEEATQKTIKTVTASEGEMENFKAIAADYVAEHKFEAVKAVEVVAQSRKAAETHQKPAAIVASDFIEQGYFTIVFPEHNTHRTFRVKKVKEGNLAGKIIIGYLSGSDNESSYTNFGFLENNVIKFWRQASTPDREKITLDDTKRARIVSAFKKVTSNAHEAGKAYALASTRCYKCNRLLTHPESIPVGMGPDCAGRSGY